MSRRRPRSSRAGFTVVEMVIAAALLATIVGLSLGVMSTTTDQVADGTIRQDLRLRAQGAGTLIQRELRAVSRSHLVLSNPHASTGFFTRVSYRTVVGFNATTNVPTLDPTAASSQFHEVRFVLASGETANGTDDDGDGLIDEGRLVLYRSGVEMATIVDGVDGSSIEITLCAGTTEQPTLTLPTSANTHLVVRFDLQQRGRRAGRLERQPYEVAVGLRN